MKKKYLSKIIANDNDGLQMISAYCAGSEIKVSDIKMLSKRHITKFNVGTVLRKSFGDSLRLTLESDSNLFDRIAIMKKVIPDLQVTASRVIKLLGQ